MKLNPYRYDSTELVNFPAVEGRQLRKDKTDGVVI
jgi:hypothetical protein